MNNLIFDIYFHYIILLAFNEIIIFFKNYIYLKLPSFMCILLVCKTGYC